MLSACVKTEIKSEALESTGQDLGQTFIENKSSLENRPTLRSDNVKEHFRKLFIGGLQYETTEETVKNHFKQWGKIVDCVVMRDIYTKESRGFGFITYDNADSIDAAQSNRPHRLDNKVVETKRATPRELSGDPKALMTTNKVFVGGIKEDTTEKMLREYFSRFGNIKKLDVITDKETKKKRGFGFITFDDYDPVDKIVLVKIHNIGGFKCDVKKALSKQEMVDARSRGGGRGDGQLVSPASFECSGIGAGFDRGPPIGGWNDGGCPGFFGNNNYVQSIGNGDNYGGGYNDKWVRIHGGSEGGGQWKYNPGGGNWSGNQGGVSQFGSNQGGGNWGGNQGGVCQWGGNQAGGNWSGNQGDVGQLIDNQGGGNWGGNQGGGSWDGNQGGGSWDGNQGGGSWGGNQCVGNWNDNQGCGYGDGGYGQQKGGAGGNWDNNCNQGGGGQGGGYGGGPMREGGNYMQRSQGPYGGGAGGNWDNNCNQGGGGQGGGYGGGPMRGGGNYMQRSQGPYGALGKNYILKLSLVEVEAGDVKGNRCDDGDNGGGLGVAPSILLELAKLLGKQAPE